jgi:hypothetical protein
LRTGLAATCTILAFLLVWFALVAPDEIDRLSFGAFIRIPVEGLVLAAIILTAPDRIRRVVVMLVGLALGLLTIVKVLDMGFYAVLDRPFDPITDWYYLGPAVGVLEDSIGQPRAMVWVITAALLASAVVVLTPLALRRLARLLNRNRRPSALVVAALGVMWIPCAAFDVQFTEDAPVASSSAANMAYDEVRQLRAGIRDHQTFAREIATDHFRNTSAQHLVSGLRGKDVLLVFVESYGRVAIQDSSFSPRIDAVLDNGTRRLRAAGFSSRSAFLTSPTFGAASWLAHSTLQSGLWVDTQQRYNQLVTARRLTLTDAFGRAGWQTVFDVPAITHDWSQGAAFYRYDKVYDAGNVGYHGPKFSYATMPDQYTLAAFRRLELARPDRRPVMAEIDLVSSHHPWTPLPRAVDWDGIGDGSVFNDVPAVGESPDVVFRDEDKVRAAYGRSIEYSMKTLVSFLQTYPDPNLVLIVLGDHQPHTYVTGSHPGHDVPITIIAHDPRVMARLSAWGWQDGLRPGPEAPVWRMDSFRDRFFTAYGPPR